MGEIVFAGFQHPVQNWSKLPNELLDAFDQITTVGELKVLLYVLRHTWGYQDTGTPKPITMDEFMHGRKRRDGSRIDKGVSMSEPAIRAGINSAVGHGFMSVDVDDTDKARVQKSYAIRVFGDIPGEKVLPPGGKSFTPRGKESLPRSEKETIEKETIEKTTDVQPTLESIIKSWIDAQPGYKPVNAYKNKTNRESATSILNDGFTPDDVKKYIQAKQTTWKGDSIPLNYVAANIGVWAKSQPAAKQLGARHAVGTWHMLDGELVKVSIVNDSTYIVETPSGRRHAATHDQLQPKPDNVIPPTQNELDLTGAPATPEAMRAALGALFKGGGGITNLDDLEAKKGA